MRRPGVRFWRVVFAASVVLFVAGMALAAVVANRVGLVVVSQTALVYYGDGIITIDVSATMQERELSQFKWMVFASSPPTFVFRPLWTLRPKYGPNGNLRGLEVSAYYIPALSLITAVPSAILLRRHKNKIAAGLCAGCGYSLAGLPVDAAACPECGGKIHKSAAPAS